MPLPGNRLASAASFSSSRPFESPGGQRVHPIDSGRRDSRPAVAVTTPGRTMRRAWTGPPRDAQRGRRSKGTGVVVRREKSWVFSGCNSHPAPGSLQPVAIGAAVEVTKPSEPSRQMYRSGDAASGQVVTRVNVEQASKRPMWVPTRQRLGEGCHRWGIRETVGIGRPASDQLPSGPTGVMTTTCPHTEISRNTGNPSSEGT